MTAKKKPIPVLDTVKLRNKLGSYPSYTYNVSLHLLTPSEYNAMKANPRSYVPKNVLIAGAGRHNANTFVRNKFFLEDFYIEDISVVSVIGMTERSHSSTDLTIDFRIVEPYGITLFDRIYFLTQDIPELKKISWADLGYMLQIDFFGYDDEGKQLPTPIPETTKCFPIQLVDVSLKVTNQGSEYKCKAVARDHQAFNADYGTVHASGTINASTFGGFMSGFIGKLNEWQQQMKKKEKIEIPTVYDFDLSEFPELANSKITSLNPKRSAMPDPTTVNRSVPQNREKENNESTIAKDLDIPITAGTTILTQIENMAKVSSFFVDQVNSTENKPIVWIKIIPKITEIPGSYDNIKKVIGRNITYKIIPYEIYANKYPYGPRPKIPINKIMKQYEYIYTGKNTEILEWSLDFNNTFATLLSTKGRAFDNDTTTLDPTGSTKVNPDPSISGSIVNWIDEWFTPNRILPINQQPSEISTMDQDKDSTTILAADMFKSMLSSKAKGDMATVKLKILGDPDFIKQDGIFYESSKSDNPFTINMDACQVFAYLSFKTFVDIDENTGMYTTDTPSFSTAGQKQRVAYDSAFSGIYHALTVTSSFHAGKFEQELTLVRAFDQETAPNVIIRSSRVNI